MSSESEIRILLQVVAPFYRGRPQHRCALNKNAGTLPAVLDGARPPFVAAEPPGEGGGGGAFPSAWWKACSAAHGETIRYYVLIPIFFVF